VIVRLGPLTNTTFHCLVKRICASLHEGIEWEGHSLPFWLVVEGYDSTALDTEIERMYILGQDSLPRPPWVVVLDVQSPDGNRVFINAQADAAGGLLR